MSSFSKKTGGGDHGTGWTAKRFTQKPLRQPTYDFRDVPKCSPDLTGSSLHFLTEREHFVEAMSEMVLLCIEAMRRQKGSGGRKRSSKPLSLEYMADRLDVDDPICGYLVRTKEKPPAPTDGVVSDKWEMGMLQGFITVTTFTNWQKSFRWDSMHDSAFAYDDERLAEQMASGERKYDGDGSLAKALEATVNSGDPWEEGIVWPRIAEISLLGGLGCGKALLSLAIEHLENLKATAKANYDYVVLQATDNSIPFYESMGFVRVGAITLDDKFAEKQAVVCETCSHSSDADAGPILVAEPVDDSSSSGSRESPPTTSEIVSSPTILYTTEKPGETIRDIAKRYHADPWDTVFLNQNVYESLTPSSRLIKGTILRIPEPTTESPSESTNDVSHNNTDAPQWYIARENDTPRMIARKFSVNCSELVEANKGRLPGLLAVSRLKEGTRVKISHFHIHDDMHVPYCHWTFPDDDFESGEPSYMMVRKLVRRNGKHFPVEASLAVPVSPYTPAQLLMAAATTTTTSRNTASLQNESIPKAPKRPPSAFMLFVAKQRETRDFGKIRLSEISKLLSAEWKLLSGSERQCFYDEFEKIRVKYQEAKDNYAQLKAEIVAANPDWASGGHRHLEQVDLFNKVVRLKPGAVRDESEYTYWYVLTYIPDLKWCHLGPLYSDGTFGPDKPKSEGRTKWRLVDEKLGKELDISADFCIPVKSKSLKKTQDADKEEWDIIDMPPQPGSTNLANSQPEVVTRTSPRRKSELPDTLCERRPSETIQRPLKEAIRGRIPPPAYASVPKAKQQKKTVCNPKISGQKRKSADRSVERPKIGNLADATALVPRSVIVRVTMSSSESKRKCSDLFLEEPLVALCSGKGIDLQHDNKQLTTDVSFTKTPAKSTPAKIQSKKRFYAAFSPPRSAMDVDPTDSDNLRPKRKAAPSYLGESPFSIPASHNKQVPKARAATKPMGGTIKKKTKRSLDASVNPPTTTKPSKPLAPENIEEPLQRDKRKASPFVLENQPVRKRLAAKSAGGRRSV